MPSTLDVTGPLVALAGTIVVLGSPIPDGPMLMRWPLTVTTVEKVASMRYVVPSTTAVEPATSTTTPGAAVTRVGATLMASFCNGLSGPKPMVVVGAIISLGRTVNCTPDCEMIASFPPSGIGIADVPIMTDEGRTAMGTFPIVVWAAGAVGGAGNKSEPMIEVMKSTGPGVV